MHLLKHIIARSVTRVKVYFRVTPHPQYGPFSPTSSMAINAPSSVCIQHQPSASTRPGATHETPAIIAGMTAGVSIVWQKLRRTRRDHASRDEIRSVAPTGRSQPGFRVLSHILAESFYFYRHPKQKTGVFYVRLRSLDSVTTVCTSTTFLPLFRGFRFQQILDFSKFSF